MISISNNIYRVNIYQLINIDNQPYAEKDPRQWNEKVQRDSFENLKQNYYIVKMTHLGAHAKQRRGGYC
jgi:hypothetical protein